MRKLRVTASMRKRLADARSSNGSGAPRGGVMVIPPMRSVEDWESAALASQAKLIADARDSISVPSESHPLQIGDDVSAKYKPDPARPRTPEASGGQRGR